MVDREALAERAKELELVPLADCSDGEIEKIRLIRNEPAISVNMYTSHEIAGNEHRNWVKKVLLRDDLHFFAIRQDGAIVGAASLSSIDRQQHSADWAFYLSQATRGKGLGSALEYKMITLAFHEFGLRKLGCEVLEFNEAVIALHKRFGFVEEERLKARITRDGIDYDAIRLGLTSDQFEGLGIKPATR